MKNDKTNIIKTGTDIVLETIWPTRCVVCDKPGNLLCAKCAISLPFIDSTKACKTCGEPYAKIQCCRCTSTDQEHAEEDTVNNTNEFDKCISVAILNEDTGRIIAIYKDGGERRLAKVIAFFINQYIPPQWIGDNVALAYIPSTKAALDKRGFDHSNEICEHLAFLSGLRIIDIFERPKNTDQRLLSRRQRQKNMESAIRVKNDIKTIPQSIILVDDVFTTGATLNACSKKLHNYGVKNVFCITFCRTF